MDEDDLVFESHNWLGVVDVVYPLQENTIYDIIIIYGNWTGNKHMCFWASLDPVPADWDKHDPKQDLLDSDTSKLYFYQYSGYHDNYSFTSLNNTNIATAINNWLGTKDQAFEALKTYGPINDWNVSAVTDMSSLFSGKTTFNYDISNWNVGNVTDMSGMFNGATSFNQPLNNWNVGKVTNMANMFYGATSFNQPLNNWNVGKVTNMNSMFRYCSVFNQNINSWDVSKVTNIGVMFGQCPSFNQPLDEWDVGNVTQMDHVFYGATIFNQEIGNWDVSNALTIHALFSGAFGFDRNISRWDVRKVTDSQKWGGDQNGANGHPDLHFRDSHVLDKYFTIMEGRNQWLDLYVRSVRDNNSFGPTKVSEMQHNGHDITGNNVNTTHNGHDNLDKVEIYSSDGYTYYIRFKDDSGNYYIINRDASNSDGGSGFGSYHYQNNSNFVGFVPIGVNEADTKPITDGMEFKNLEMDEAITYPTGGAGTTIIPRWPHNIYLRVKTGWNEDRFLTQRSGWRLDKKLDKLEKDEDKLHIFSAGPQTAALPIQPYYVYEFYISAQSHYHVGLGPHIQQCLVDGVLYPPTGDVSIFADPDHSGTLLDMFEDGGQACWTYCPGVGTLFMTITLGSRPSFLGLHMVVPCMDQGGE